MRNLTNIILFYDNRSNNNYSQHKKSNNFIYNFSCKLGILLVCLFTVHFVKAQPGANDHSFNVIDNGTFGIGTGTNSTVFTSTVQVDGKIIIGGSFTSYNGTSRNRIARLNVDGSLDATFNPGTGSSANVYTTTLQADGKIIIGGLFTSYSGTSRNRIARLNANGCLDTTFNPGTGANADVWATAVQADGKIIIVGNFTSYNGTTINRIARLNVDGSLDATFNPGGSGANVVVRASTLQADGKIIIGGNFTSYNGTTINRIARLNVDGSLDATFNPGGSGANAYVWTTAVQADGKIIIGGHFTSYNGATRNYITRLNSDGSLDATFNPGGSGPWANNPSRTVVNATLQADGKIIIGGQFTLYNGTSRNRIARLNVDGSLDATFNPGTGASADVWTSTLQADGKIIIGGQFTIFNGLETSTIVRLNSDGSLDATFNPGTGANQIVYTTTLQADGKIIIGGEFKKINGVYRNGIARLNANGSLDATFNPGTGANGQVYFSTLLADGKIMIGGGFSNYNGTTRGYMARVNSDGSLDATFPNGGNGASSTVISISFQADGKIIIGGIFFNYNGTSRNRIARLNLDGSLDATFNPGTGFNSDVWTTAVQADGKIIIGGNFTTYNSITRNRIARLNADGTFDNSFNMGTGFSGLVYTTALQADGKVIVGGIFTNYNGTPVNRIARLNTDGSLDATFNPGGVGAGGNVHTISFQADGKIIIGGTFSSYNGTPINRIARLNADGTLDTSFDPGTGAVGVNLPGVAVRTATPQDDGKIIIGGNFYSYNGVPRNRLARIIGDGTMLANPPTWTGAVSSVWSNDQNWLNFIIPQAADEAIIPNEGVNFDPIIEGTVSVAMISIASERILTINSSGSLSVSGVLTNNGTLTLQSGGALLQAVGSSNAGTGTYNIQRTIPAGPNNAFRFMGSPIKDIAATGVSGVTTSGSNGGQVTPMSNCNPNFVATGSPYSNILELRENPAEVLFNCAQSLWFVKSAGNLENGRGYALRVNGGQTLTFSGTVVNNGSVEISGLARQAGTIEDHLSTLLNLGPISRGWHLLSNPYPSPIVIPPDFLSLQGFDNQIQLWNSSTNEWIPRISLHNCDTTLIAVGQGFQIRRSGDDTGNSAATLTLSNAIRRATTGVNFLNVPVMGDYRLNIQVNGNSKSDRSLIFFHLNGTPAFDAQYDVNKFIGGVSNPALFTMAGSERMAFNGLPLLSQATSVPLVFYVGTSGTYSLSFDDLESFPASTMIYLEDKKTGVWTNLRLQNFYTFTSRTSDNIQRFNIHFEPPVNITNENYACKNEAFIALSNPSNETWNYALIKNGVTLSEGFLSATETRIESLGSGVYNLKLSNSSGIAVEEDVLIQADGLLQSIFESMKESYYINDQIEARILNPDSDAEYRWYINDLFAGVGLELHFIISDAGRYQLRLEASKGICKSSNYHDFTVEAPLTIRNILQNYGFSAYPNPANEMINLVWNEGIGEISQISIYDISGRMIRIQQFSERIKGNQISLDVSDLNKGIYLITAEGKDFRNTVNVSVVK